VQRAQRLIEAEPALARQQRQVDPFGQRAELGEGGLDGAAITGRASPWVSAQTGSSSGSASASARARPADDREAIPSGRMRPEMKRRSPRGSWRSTVDRKPPMKRMTTPSAVRTSM
jgi:hypothetical protein